MVNGTDYELVRTWDHLDAYAEVDWRNLNDINGSDYDFIRVIGDAKAEEAAEVISAISKFRQRWEGYCVSNAVRVEGHEMVSDMAATSIEDIKAFDVLDAILQELDEKEASVVKELLNA